jgi:hypothetical protein
VVTAIITVVLGLFATRIRIAPDINAILPKQSKAMQFASDTGQSFSSEYLVIAVQSPELYTVEKLAAFADAIAELEKLPQVRGSTSPFNFVTFRAEGRRVLPTQLGPGGRAPSTAEDLAAFRERITTDPLARNLVLSRDGSTLACVLAVEVIQDYGPLLAGVDRIVARLKPYYTVYIAGSPPLIDASQKYLKRDIPRLLAGAIVVVLVVFFFGFRSKRSFFLPFLIVGLGALWTCGIMSILGFNLSLVSLMVPPLVLVLGSSYSIHVLTQYYRDAEPDAPDKAWIPRSVTRIVQTVFLAAGTTVFGFLGLLTAQIRQIKEFGIAAAIGITLCALLSLFFFPAVLSRLRPPRQRDRERVDAGLVARIMTRLGRWVFRWRFAVLAALVVIAGGFALTISTIRYDTNYLSYFRTREKAVEETRFVVREFGGYASVRITLTAPDRRAGYFLDPSVLGRVASLERRLREDPDVAYIFSFTSYLAAYNRALTGTAGIPDGRAPVQAFSRLFRAATNTPAGREIVGELADDTFSRLTLVVRVFDSRRGSLMYEEKLAGFARDAGRIAVDAVGAELAPLVWGPTMVAVEVSRQLAEDQISSSLISTGLILLLTAFSFRSIKYGLFTIVPTATGVMLNFLVMALFSIPLDIVTVMFSSIAMGVGVDTSIHVIIQYRRQRAIGGEPAEVVANSLRNAGRPILHTVTSLVAGLLVFLASSVQPIAYFGLLVSLAIVTTSAGSLVLLPAILATEMTLGDRWRRARAAKGRATDR